MRFVWNSALPLDDVRSSFGALFTNSDYDGIIASKWKGNSFFKHNQPFFRKFFSRGWNFFTRLVLFLPYYDTQTGMKFFKREVIASLRNESFVCKGYSFDAELLFKLKKKRFKIKEKPVIFSHIEGGDFNLSYVFTMFLDIIKVRFGLKG